MIELAVPLDNNVPVIHTLVHRFFVASLRGVADTDVDWSIVRGQPWSWGSRMNNDVGRAILPSLDPVHSVMKQLLGKSQPYPEFIGECQQGRRSGGHGRSQTALFKAQGRIVEALEADP